MTQFDRKSFGILGKGRPPADCERAGGHGKPDRRGRCVWCGTKIEPRTDAEDEERERFRQRHIRRQMKRRGLDPNNVADYMKFMLEQPTPFVRKLRKKKNRNNVES